VLEQRSRRLGAEPAERDLREPGAREPGLALISKRHHEGDALGIEASRREDERVRGGVVEEVRVVDDREQRRLLGGGGEEAERRRGDREPVARDGRAERERAR
jgi:hypothetical protein